MRQAFPLRRGMTIIEVMVVIGVVILVAALALPFIGGMRNHQHGARPLKDSTQIRGIIQACAIWAQNNQDRYPTPSEIDLNGDTIARPAGLVGPDRRLDTTGHMMSLLMWNGFFPVELAVSPAEAGNVQVMQNFESANPSAAVNPTQALWDPAFRGTPLDEWGGKVPGKVGDPGNNSYAQVPWFDDRTPLWGNTFNATEAILGNRGPAYTLHNGGWQPTQGSSFGSRSTTMLIHGPRTAWNGNVGFNDHHVEFLTQADPSTLMWTFTGLPGGTPQMVADNMFHAEHDHTRAPIDEHIQEVSGSDGRGTLHGDGSQSGPGALDQQNNYLRPISHVLPGQNGQVTAEFWID
jgi:hypothetical protein